MNKLEGIELVKTLLQEQCAIVESELREVIHSRDNESKSSVGDKYETGRTMMQHRQEQLEKQLLAHQQNIQYFLRLMHNKPSATIGEGSWVRTNAGYYLIGLGLGLIKHTEGNFHSISLASPFGQVMQGKRAGDAFTFRGQNYQILSVD